jgi:AcrR family transcriptional regulator
MKHVVEMRQKIKRVATDLLIKHGYHGMSFGKVASRLGTTTTNIHYHFGNKIRLVEEVLDDYVKNTLDRHRQIWLNENATLVQKIRDAVEFNRERHRRYNRGSFGGNSWSLIGRLRLESDVLSEPARKSLQSFTEGLQAAISSAVERARRNRELTADAPVEDIAFLLVNIVNSSSVFTRDAGNFERLEKFFDTFIRFIRHAYGPEKSGSLTG